MIRRDRRLTGFARDERAVGFQLIVAFLFLAFVAATLAMLVDPVDMLVDKAHEQSAGTEYENSGQTMADRLWRLFTALPLIAAIMALMYVVAMAVLHSSR